MGPDSGSQEVDSFFELLILRVELIEFGLGLLTTRIAVRSEQGVDRQDQTRSEGDTRNPSSASQHSP